MLSSSWDGRPFGHNRHGLKKGVCCAPFGGGELGPHLTHVAWAEDHLYTKWHLDLSDRLATIHQRHRQDRTDNGPIAQVKPFYKWSPKNTTQKIRKYERPTFAANHLTDINKSSAVAEMGDRLEKIDMGQKLEGCAPFLDGGTGSLSHTMSSGPRPTSVPTGILMHPAVWT